MADKGADELIHDNVVKEVVEKIRSEVAKTTFPVEVSLTIAASICAEVLLDAMRANHPPEVYHRLCDDIHVVTGDKLRAGA